MQEARYLAHRTRATSLAWEAAGETKLAEHFNECVSALGSLAAQLEAREEAQAALKGLLRESLGWMEGIEPKPAAPFLSEIRTALAPDETGGEAFACSGADYHLPACGGTCGADD